jgi:hypothetical protein
MSSQVQRLSRALQRVHPGMFGGGPRAASLEDGFALFEQVAERLVELGVRLHQGDDEALREAPFTSTGAPSAEFQANLLTVERVSNGFLIRHAPSARSIVVSDDGHGRVHVAADMLAYVNETIGEAGSAHEPERVRVIVLPGDHWIPTDPGDCEHRWVERLDPERSWFCPCGAQFQLEHEGRSLSAMVSLEAPRE